MVISNVQRYHAAYLVRAMYAGRPLRLGCPVGDGSRHHATPIEPSRRRRKRLSDSNLTHVFHFLTRTEDRVVQMNAREPSCQVRHP